MQLSIKHRGRASAPFEVTDIQQLSKVLAYISNEFTNTDEQISSSEMLAQLNESFFQNPELVDQQKLESENLAFTGEWQASKFQPTLVEIPVDRELYHNLGTYLQGKTAQDVCQDYDAKYGTSLSNRLGRATQTLRDSGASLMSGVQQLPSTAVSALRPASESLRASGAWLSNQGRQLGNASRRQLGNASNALRGMGRFAQGLGHKASEKLQPLRGPLARGADFMQRLAPHALVAAGVYGASGFLAVTTGLALPPLAFVGLSFGVTGSFDLARQAFKKRQCSNFNKKRTFGHDHLSGYEIEAFLVGVDAQKSLLAQAKSWLNRASYSLAFYAGMGAQSADNLELIKGVEGEAELRQGQAAHAAQVAESIVAKTQALSEQLQAGAQQQPACCSGAQCDGAAEHPILHSMSIAAPSSDHRQPDTTPQTTPSPETSSPSRRTSTGY